MTDATAPAVLGSEAQSLPDSAAPSAEYVETMRAAAHTDPVPAGDKPKHERPEHIPEKFWDADKGEARWDDLAKSYAELEKSASAKKTDEAAEDPEADTKETAKIERKDQDKPEGEAEANPLTVAVEEMAKAYESGEVTDDHIKAVEDLGLPRNVIDTYLAGVKALETLALNEVHAAAGGADSFKAAQDWAAEKLSDQDLDYYNAGVADPAKRTQTVEWLMAKFKAARPSEGRLVEGRPSTDTSGDVFRSQAQVTEAMASQQYRTDPAFRQQVAEKLLRSKRAGTITTGASFHQRAR